MGFKCGIVGLPNVGKSTLFNALTNSAVAAENYPFCTVDPNLGVVPVPDERIAKLAVVANKGKLVPSTMSFTDIAGLVEGSHRGEGLGNQFLSHIRDVDAIAHVVRCFSDPNVSHVRESVSALDDIATINTELVLADLETATRAEERMRNVARAGTREDKAHHAALIQISVALNENQPLRLLDLDAQVLELIRDYRFLTLKPVMYVANVDEDALDNLDGEAANVRELAASEQAEFVVVSSKLEAEIAQLGSEAERVEYLEMAGLSEAGLTRVIHTGYRLLGLHHFFTIGPDEVRAWAIPIGALAPAAAGKIHTDFERGFIRAEVADFETFVENDGDAGCRKAGLMRAEGKNYEIADGDVIHFLFNV